MVIQKDESYESSKAMVGLVVNALDALIPNRYTANLVNQLVYTPYRGSGNYFFQFVIAEIAHLEDLKKISTKTKDAEQFQRPEMAHFWKKHYITPEHTPMNLLSYWQYGRAKSKKFENAMSPSFNSFNKIQKPSDQECRETAKKLASICMDGLKSEPFSSKKKTGDYIIFQKYNEENYYLCLGKHKDDDVILKWVKSGYKTFPFLEK
ncbi:MAG: hypothetical protein COB36_06905 [Alphaproteobacteria bacterium]|nr:MAG: hypothetical protein COB36_06905 [Alphaproteobacteria bacterium]